MKAKAAGPTFVAIDFETADTGRDSACAVGVVRVEAGRVVRREHRLIRPPRRTFQFTYLHGISWRDVEREGTFDDVRPTLASVLAPARGRAIRNRCAVGRRNADRPSGQKEAPEVEGFLQQPRGLSPVGETGFEPATPWSRRTKCGHPPLRTASLRLASVRNFTSRGHRRSPPDGRFSTTYQSAYGAGTAAIRAARGAAHRCGSGPAAPRLQGHRLQDGEGRLASSCPRAQRRPHPEIRLGRVRYAGFVSRERRPSCELSPGLRDVRGRRRHDAGKLRRKSPNPSVEEIESQLDRWLLQVDEWLPILGHGEDHEAAVEVP